MRRLSDLDAQFLAIEDRTQNAHYCALALYDTRQEAEPLDASRVKRLLAERLHLLPPLRWKVEPVPFGLDHPSFVECDVDLGRHVEDVMLAEPGDRRTLGKAVSAVLAEPLDRDRPLWRVLVFHGLDDGRVAVAIVLHHAAIDGISANHLFNVILDMEPDGAVFEEASPGATITERPKGRTVRVLRGLRGALAQPVRALRVAPRALPHLDQHPTLRSFPGVWAMARLAQALRRVFRPRLDPIIAENVKAPFTAFTANLSHGHSVAFDSVPLEPVKAVKTALG